LAAAGPFAIGCDLFKPKATDAGVDGSVVVAPAVTDTTVANPAVTPLATTAAPLTPGAPAPAAVPPAATTNAGAVTDSGVKTDAAPAPVPALPIFPAFDASALSGFDAGSLFRIPDGGKLPWQK
jgi:hypothetical protein